MIYFFVLLSAVNCHKMFCLFTFSHQLTISSQNGASQYIFSIYPQISNCSRQSESLTWGFKLDMAHTLGITIIKKYVRFISASSGSSLINVSILKLRWHYGKNGQIFILSHGLIGKKPHLPSHFLLDILTPVAFLCFWFQ